MQILWQNIYCGNIYCFNTLNTLHLPLFSWPLIFVMIHIYCHLKTISRFSVPAHIFHVSERFNTSSTVINLSQGPHQSLEWQLQGIRKSNKKYLVKSWKSDFKTERFKLQLLELIEIYWSITGAGRLET